MIRARSGASSSARRRRATADATQAHPAARTTSASGHGAGRSRVAREAGLESGASRSWRPGPPFGDAVRSSAAAADSADVRPAACATATVAAAAEPTDLPAVPRATSPPTRGRGIARGDETTPTTDRLAVRVGRVSEPRSVTTGASASTAEREAAGRGAPDCADPGRGAAELGAPFVIVGCGCRPEAAGCGAASAGAVCTGAEDDVAAEAGVGTGSGAAGVADSGT